MSESKDLTITRQLPVKLDQYRKNALHDQMVTADVEARRINLHMKNVTDSLKAQIKDYERRRTVAADTLHQGFEMQPVAVQELPDLERNVMIAMRMDTGEALPERPLTVEEIKFHMKARK